MVPDLTPTDATSKESEDWRLTKPGVRCTKLSECGTRLDTIGAFQGSVFSSGVCGLLSSWFFGFQRKGLSPPLPRWSRKHLQPKKEAKGESIARREPLSVEKKVPGILS